MTLYFKPAWDAQIEMPSITNTAVNLGTKLTRYVIPIQLQQIGRLACFRKHWRKEPKAIRGDYPLNLKQFLILILTRTIISVSAIR